MKRWEQYCVVGLGGHARTKLIPAIEANGQSIAGIVSRQPPETLPDVPHFADLDTALAALPRSTAIVIASPPSVHYAQVRAAIMAGFDVIVEKPAFVTVAEATDIAAKCAATGAILVEAFMQRHSPLYQRLLDQCASMRDYALDIAFIIPSLPADTFRGSSDIAASGLYDIGCYILALLNDLGLDLNEFNIVDVDAAGTNEESIQFAGTLDGISISARAGVGANYENCVTVRRAGGSQASFHPFFYGRSGTRNMGLEQFEEGNAFEAMFAVPREAWLMQQNQRLKAIVNVTAHLERLAAQLAEYRARALRGPARSG